LWDAERGEKLRTFQGHTLPVLRVAFSPDGRRVLTGSWDETAILWDTERGEKLRTFQGHTSSVMSVAFSPDGRRVLTGSWDGTTRLWDAESGQELCQLISLDAGAEWLVVSPGGVFDGSPAGIARFVSLRKPGTAELVPMNQVRAYHRPGLLARLLKGEPVR
jgi:WD40 repeat protein